MYSFAYNSTREQVRAELAQLRALGWIDRGTRAIMLEFTIVNPGASMFYWTRVLLELPPEGGVIAENPYTQL